MHPQDETVLKRYKWSLLHPLWWQIIIYFLIAVYFIIQTVPSTFGYAIHKTALHICIFVPIGILVVSQLWLERQGIQALQKLHTKNLSATELLQIYEEFYVEIDFSKRRNFGTYRNYVMDVAPLYTLVGAFDRAIGLYQDLLSAKYKKVVPKGLRPSILGDLADCFAEKGDADAARNAMHEVDEAMQKVIRHNRKKQKLIEENINVCTRAKLELRNGNPVPMEELLKKQAQTETSNDPFERIVIERLRGWMAYLSGEYAEAKRAYMYVAEHGKDTFYEQEAKYYLDKIREQNEN